MKFHCEVGFIGLKTTNKHFDGWVVPIKTLVKSIRLKLDCGADHSVIPRINIQTVLKKALLKNTNNILLALTEHL